MILELVCMEKRGLSLKPESCLLCTKECINNEHLWGQEELRPAPSPTN
jgi:hypothetical protein